MGQTLLLHLWKVLPSFDINKCSFGAFAWINFRDRTIQQIKFCKTKKRDSILISFEDEIAEGLTIEDTISSEEDVFRNVSENLESNSYRSLLNKEAEYFFIKELSIKQIAKKMHRSELYISNKIKSNIRKIKNCMEESYAK